MKAWRRLFWSFVYYLLSQVLRLWLLFWWFPFVLVKSTLLELHRDGIYLYLPVFRAQKTLSCFIFVGFRIVRHAYRILRASMDSVTLLDELANEIAQNVVHLLAAIFLICAFRKNFVKRTRGPVEIRRVENNSRRMMEPALSCHLISVVWRMTWWGRFEGNIGRRWWRVRELWSRFLKILVHKELLLLLSGGLHVEI